MKKRNWLGVIMLSTAVAHSEIVVTEGFNSHFPDCRFSAFGLQFGVSVPGIVTDGSVRGIEGDGFAALNTSQSSVDGVAVVIGGMDLSIGTVESAGITYTFSGGFGWRYGSADAASDLAVLYGQTGFVIDGTTHPAGDFSEFNFGTSTEGPSQLAVHFFSYTTVAADVGKEILVRIRLVDKNNVDGLTQLLADNWQIIKTP